MVDTKRIDKYSSRFYHCISKSEIFQIVADAIEDEYVTSDDFLILVSLAQKHLYLIALIDINNEPLRRS